MSERRLPVPLVIAAVPLLSYIAAFRFEHGYLDYFNLPTTLVKVSLELTLSNGLAIFSVALGIVWIVNGVVLALTKALDHPHWFVRRTAVVHILLFAFCVLLIKAYGWNWVVLTIFAIVVLLIDALLFLPELFARSSGRPWYERVAESLEKDPAQSVYDRLHAALGSSVYFGLINVMFISYFGSYLAGVATARGVRAFDVSTDTSQALIRRYGDTAVLKAVDLAEGKILNAMSVLTPEELSTMTFERVRLPVVTVEPVRREVASEETAENAEEPAKAVEPMPIEPDLGESGDVP